MTDPKRLTIVMEKNTILNLAVDTVVEPCLPRKILSNEFHFLSGAADF